MKKNLRDNLSRFFDDGGRVSLAVLVIGVLARRPLKPDELTAGIVLTLMFTLVGVRVDVMEA